MEYLENIEFYEALEQYYKLKSNYENNYEKDKIKIIKDQTKSWREKRSEFQKLKPKCINCKRPVGTRFTNVYDTKEAATILRAVCGSLSEPCNLNIELKSTKIELYPEIIQGLEKDIRESKLDIINSKNKLIFNYINSEEAIEIFDKIKGNIQDTTDILAFYLEEYIQITENREKESILKEDIEKSYLMVNDMKELVKKYEETSNTKIVQDIVTIYVNQLLPLLKKIRDTKYSKNSVEYNPDDNTYHLIQEKYTLGDISVRYSKPEIINFVIGIEQKSSKQKPKLLVVEEEESESESEQSIE
jgi:hypothetical protein